MLNLATMLLALATTAEVSTGGRLVTCGDVSFVQGTIVVAEPFGLGVKFTILAVEWDEVEPPRGDGDVWYFDLPTRWWSEVIVEPEPDGVPNWKRNPRTYEGAQRQWRLHQIREWGAAMFSVNLSDKCRTLLFGHNP